MELHYVSCGICNASHVKGEYCHYCGAYATIRVNGVVVYVDRGTGKLLGKFSPLSARIEATAKRIGF